MNGRTIFRVFALLLAVGLAIGIGTMVYNAGVSAGLTAAAQQAVSSGEPIPAVPYGYGYGGPYAHGPFGFGVFGLIFGIFAIFLIIGLVRMAFGFGRWRGRGPGGWRGPAPMAGAAGGMRWSRNGIASCTAVTRGARLLRPESSAPSAPEGCNRMRRCRGS